MTHASLVSVLVLSLIKVSGHHLRTAKPVGGHARLAGSANLKALLLCSKDVPEPFLFFFARQSYM